MEVVLNHIDFKFFVKMIGIESFKNPKNWKGFFFIRKNKMLMV
jgi:hypothetical protein